MNQLNRVIFSSIILLILDSIYLGFNRKTWESQVVKIQRVVMKVKFLPALLCYILLIFALNYFILRTKRSILDAFLNLSHILLPASLGDIYSFIGILMF